MKAKLLVTIVAVFCLYSMVSAQGYDIRTTSRNNLRAAPSLDGTFLETVPSGTVLHVVGRLNRWLRISRNGREVWMADWVGYSRVESSAGAAPQPAINVPAQVDNCCFVDRQCQSAQDWENGYWAFQNNQCATPGQSQPQRPTQPVSIVTTNVDNCCFVDRQCHTPVDWENGYYAFRDGQCPAPAQSQPQTPTQPVRNVPANVDNCCFVDRQCHTPADWENGYYAFRDNQCAAQAQAQTYSQPAGNASGPIDNCCRVNRQCHNADDWDQGFYAYLAGECPVSGGARRVAWTSYMPAGVTQFLTDLSRDPFNNCCYMHHGTCHSSDDWSRGHRDYRRGECIRPAPLGTRPAIVGNDKFRYLVENALALIATHAPEWLHFIDNSGTLMFEARVDQAGGFYNQQWSIVHGWTKFENDDPHWLPDYDYLVGYAGGITHEACHAIMQRTYSQTAGWRNEAPCVEAQLAVIEAINPNSPDVPWLRDLVANIRNPEVWWWD
ncbi:MAG: SH3 domain-containing protein [Chloroflexi bacterium]|nr:SH3 domain-containing protein [Chloroflexota bacterium]